MVRLTLLIVVVTALAVAGIPHPPGASPDRAPPKTYVLVYAASLEPVAQAWASYRHADGWSVQRERVDPLRPPRSAQAAAEMREGRRRALRDRIRARYRHHTEHGGKAFAVLLLGDEGDDGVPAWPFDQRDPMLIDHDHRDRVYISDHPYQLMDDEDELPDVALGRVPARNPEEASTVLEKVKRYERASPRGPWRRRVNYAAGEGRFGGALDLLLEQIFRSMVERLVPEAYDLSMTYAKATSIYCPPPPALTSTVLDRLGEGALLFNYVGHGSARSFDRLLVAGRSVPMLATSDLQRLSAGHDKLPIAVLTCCSAGWFDLPGGEHCLAESMLFHPTGPVAVIAGSRLTHPYANAVLQKDITHLLLVRRVATVGALDLGVTRSMLRKDAVDRELDALAMPLALAGGWKSSLRDLRVAHVRLYNLIGDPAVTIAHPTAEIRELALAERRLTGRAPAMGRGTVTITIETAPTSMASPELIRPVSSEFDPEFVGKATRNYALVNDRVLWRIEAPVTDGRFAVTIPEDLPPAAVLVKAFAVGTDGDGRAVDAFGALRLQSRRPEPP